MNIIERQSMYKYFLNGQTIKIQEYINTKLKFEQTSIASILAGYDILGYKLFNTSMVSNRHFFNTFIYITNQEFIEDLLRFDSSFSYKFTNYLINEVNINEFEKNINGKINELKEIYNSKKILFDLFDTKCKNVYPIDYTNYEPINVLSSNKPIKQVHIDYDKIIFGYVINKYLTQSNVASNTEAYLAKSYAYQNNKILDKNDLITNIDLDPLNKPNHIIFQSYLLNYISEGGLINIDILKWFIFFSDNIKISFEIIKLIYKAKIGLIDKNTFIMYLLYNTYINIPKSYKKYKIPSILFYYDSLNSKSKLLDENEKMHTLFTMINPYNIKYVDYIMLLTLKKYIMNNMIDISTSIYIYNYYLERNDILTVRYLQFIIKSFMVHNKHDTKVSLLLDFYKTKFSIIDLDSQTSKEMVIRLLIDKHKDKIFKDNEVSKYMKYPLFQFIKDKAKIEIQHNIIEYYTQYIYTKSFITTKFNIFDTNSLNDKNAITLLYKIIINYDIVINILDQIKVYSDNSINDFINEKFINNEAKNATPILILLIYIFNLMTLSYLDNSLFMIKSNISVIYIQRCFSTLSLKMDDTINANIKRYVITGLLFEEYNLKKLFCIINTLSKNLIKDFSDTLKTNSKAELIKNKDNDSVSKIKMINEATFIPSFHENIYIPSITFSIFPAYKYFNNIKKLINENETNIKIIFDNKRLDKMNTMISFSWLYADILNDKITNDINIDILNTFFTHNISYKNYNIQLGTVFLNTTDTKEAYVLRTLYEIEKNINNTLDEFEPLADTYMITDNDLKYKDYYYDHIFFKNEEDPDDIKTISDFTNSTHKYFTENESELFYMDIDESLGLNTYMLYYDEMIKLPIHKNDIQYLLYIPFNTGVIKNIELYKKYKVYNSDAFKSNNTVNLIKHYDTFIKENSNVLDHDIFNYNFISYFIINKCNDYYFYPDINDTSTISIYNNINNNLLNIKNLSRIYFNFKDKPLLNSSDLIKNFKYVDAYKYYNITLIIRSFNLDIISKLKEYLETEKSTVRKVLEHERNNIFDFDYNNLVSMLNLYPNP